MEQSGKSGSPWNSIVGKQLCVHLSETFISGCRRTLWRSRGGCSQGFLQASCDIYADVSDLYLFCAFETPSCAPLTDISALKSGQLPAADRLPRFCCYPSFCHVHPPSIPIFPSPSLSKAAITALVSATVSSLAPGEKF